MFKQGWFSSMINFKKIIEVKHFPVLIKLKTSFFLNVCGLFIFLWRELLAGTNPANILLLARTVPANNLLLAGTVPANKILLAGTHKKLKFQKIPPPHQSTP